MINIEQCSLKKKHILKIFIKATTQIIEEEGIEAVTIRKVADIAGYNSATIYNYFDNSNQLVSLAAVKFINNYIKALPDYIKNADNTLDRFILIWKCFCEYCFKQPKLYYAVFTENIGNQPENLMRNYYSIFPNKVNNHPQELVPMLMEADFAKRCEIAIQPCIDKDYFTEKEAAEINEIIRLIYQGMLSLLINNRVNYSAEEATNKTISHIKRTVYTTASTE
ncbi:TetR/AcrR family transcriptional regulator [Halanaerocella petrolearia]